MVDDWKFWRTRQMSPQAWEFIKKKGFLGMIIPREYGGLGFSHSAHSGGDSKSIASRSIGTSIYVMVPNSLGPAELLNRYGTDAQKKKYLPRLAKGEDIPCFGLTEPTAGSDAGSIISEGVFFKGYDGQIYIRLNWKKRWITLAADFYVDWVGVPDARSGKSPRQGRGFGYHLRADSFQPKRRGDWAPA